MTHSEFFKFPLARTWNPTFRHEQNKFIDRTLGDLFGLHSVVGMIGRRYAETAMRRDYVQANLELLNIAQNVHALRRHDLNLAGSDEDLATWAEAKAKRGAEIVSQAERTDNPETVAALLLDAQALAGRYGFSLPDENAVGLLPAMRRAADAKWWRIKARRAAAEEVERVAVLLRRVNKHREIYCSNLTVSRRQAQRVRNRKYLEATTATNEEGQEYTLAELSDVSVSNPRLMRMEWMTRLAGFDEVAQLYGHCRELWTFTVPSKFHPFTTAGKGTPRENPRWEKAGKPSARMAFDFLTSMFRKLRAKFGRLDMRIYGMRVVEACHDGTPHWHMAVFFPREWQGDERRAAMPRMRAIARRYALSDWQELTEEEQAAAKKHRADFKEVLPGKSAAGYLAKYIAKALPASDAADMVEQDLFGNPMEEVSGRVNAWASANRFRQFQQFGGPDVGSYRELRRIMGNEVTQADLFDAPQLIQEAAAVCDAGNWAAYVIVMGGPMAKRKDRPFKVGYWHEHDPDTGEVIGRPLTRYGEMPKARVYGIEWEGGALLSRSHTWEIGRVAPVQAEAQTNTTIKQETRDAIRATRSEWEPWAFVRRQVQENIVRALPVLKPVERKPVEKLPPPWRFSLLRGAAAPPLEFCQ